MKVQFGLLLSGGKHAYPLAHSVTAKSPLATVSYRSPNAIPPQYQRPHAQNTPLSTLASPLNQRSPPLATVKPTLRQRSLQRASAKATPLFSIFLCTFCARCTAVSKFDPLFLSLQHRSSTVLVVRLGL